jgi:hypothetical protein
MKNKKFDLNATAPKSYLANNEPNWDEMKANTMAKIGEIPFAMAKEISFWKKYKIGVAACIAVLLCAGLWLSLANGSTNYNEELSQVSNEAIADYLVNSDMDDYSLASTANWNNNQLEQVKTEDINEYIENL